MITERQLPVVSIKSRHTLHSNIQVIVTYLRCNHKTDFTATVGNKSPDMVWCLEPPLNLSLTSVRVRIALNFEMIGTKETGKLNHIRVALTPVSGQAESGLGHSNRGAREECGGSARRGTPAAGNNSHGRC